MSDPEPDPELEEEVRRRTNDNAIITRFTIEKALWNCCVSLLLTEIMPNLYLGGYVPWLFSLTFFSYPFPFPFRSFVFSPIGKPNRTLLRRNQNKK